METETKEQLQQRLTKKLRRRQYRTLLCAIICWVGSLAFHSRIMFICAVIACSIAFFGEWYMHYYVPSMSADELREDLK